jgi:hypothetical protein
MGRNSEALLSIIMTGLPPGVDSSLSLRLLHGHTSLKIHRSILQTFLVFVVAASVGLVLLSRRDRTVTVAFDYDFRLNPACSPKLTKNCVKQFNVYDISSAGRTKLFSIPVPAAAGSVKGITGTSPPVPLSAGKHTLAVTAESAEGTESDSSACATTVKVKR